MDTTFEGLIKNMVLAEKQIATAMEAGYGRRWFDLIELGIAGQFEIQKFATLIDRGPVNDLFANLGQKDSTPVKDFQTAKLSNDFMAGVSRDLALRRTSRIRSMMHATARTKSHGSGRGPLTRNTVDFLNQVQGLDEVQT